MDIAEKLKSFFEKHGIEYFASCPVEKATVTDARRLPENALSIVTFLIPYRFGNKNGNLSVYARGRDYHLFAKMLEKELSDELPETFFKLFSDTSPFDERKLAADTGLGFIGKNRLLINEKYGSFCFIGEIIFSEKLSISCGRENTSKTCMSCGKCVDACPAQCLGKDDLSPEKCMSGITQKKKVTDEESEKIASHPYVWGCDICQNVCPHNIHAEDTPIGFFREEIITDITPEILDKMDEKTFSERAFSWRGRSTVERNVSLRKEYNRNKSKNQ